jgi:D-beta-D-heptose 7-phosphate kinase/D-beta-D-heptose 1-phosphate adenosyltransferase
MKEKVAIVSGGFDPLHVGHVELINRAREISDGVIVILNTDEFLIKKKGKPFMKFEERKTILENLKNVCLVIKCVDKDQTVCETLRQLAKLRSDESLLFCNGGDRTVEAEKPEHKLCEALEIELVYGLGDKIQSSSWLTGQKKKPKSDS